MKYILGVVLLSFSVISTSYANPFSNWDRTSDMLLGITDAYAMGMAVMEEDWKGVEEFTMDLIGMQLSVSGLKALKIERRPNGADRHSFPSGHTAGAFSGAMFIHRRYGFKRAIIPYVLSVLWVGAE